VPPEIKHIVRHKGASFEVRADGSVYPTEITQWGFPSMGSFQSVKEAKQHIDRFWDGS